MLSTRSANQRRLIRLPAVLLPVAVLSAPAPARGADEAAVPAIGIDPVVELTHGNAEAESRRRLEEIVVTAGKRPEPLREIPATVTAIDGPAIESSGASTIRDILPLAPGVQLTELQPDLYRLSVRGVQTDPGTATPQSSAILIDDAPFNDPFTTQVCPDLYPFDLDGIELLQGPQGTLFGGSGLGGALRYKLTDAEPGAWRFRSFAEYQSVVDGSPNRIAGAAINVPLGSGSAVRAVAVRRLAGGTIDDLRTGESDTDESGTTSGRVLIRWNPAENWSVGLRALSQRTNADDVPLAETVDGNPVRENALRKSPSLSWFRLYGLDATYSTDWASVMSFTDAIHKKGDLSGRNGERSLGLQDFGQPVSIPARADVGGYTQEFRLVSPEGEDRSWRWLAGVFGYRYSGRSRQSAYVDEPGELLDVPLLDFAADVKARELAAFGEISRSFGRWRVTAGGRAYSIRTWGEVVSSGPLILAAGSVENRNDAEVRASGLNPKLAVQFFATPDMTLYASAARGFRFGGIQIVGPTATNSDIPSTYSPDSLWNYEVGARTRWLDDTLSADVSAFYIDWKDPQVPTTAGGVVPLNSLGNVESARSFGADLTLAWLTPLPGLGVELAAAYTNARTTAPFTTPSGDMVGSGARLPGYSNVQATATIAWTHSGGAMDFDTRMLGTWQGRGACDIEQSMPIYDYFALGLRTSVHVPALTGSPKVTLGIDNATDERPVVSAFVASDTNFTTVYLRPRTIWLRLDVGF